MKFRLFALVLALLTSYPALAGPQVTSLFDSGSAVTGALVAFKFTGADASSIRRYEVDGALESECRLSRDLYYPDTFQLKCVKAKDGA
jgi:hypothetical protein